MKIALIPIDNRPVCYDLAMNIAQIDESITLLMPEKKLLGSLTSNAKIDEIINWLEQLPKTDALIISLDTIVYGGLIPSRRSKESMKTINERLLKLKNIIAQHKNIYAFSSIMRISNNNINEEEKEYWNKYGKKIFEYSYNFHKDGIETHEVPTEILNDYIATRSRNFEINKTYIDWAEEKVFNTLVFSKDDCAEFGMNVLEADILKRIAKEKNLLKTQVLIKTGADEIPLTLMARAISEYNQAKNNLQAPKIWHKFLAPENTNLISKYEDISIEESVKAQIELCGGKIVEENEEDICLLINNFEEVQGEIVMKIKTKPFSQKLKLPSKPYMIADVRYANGADNKFVEKLLKQELRLDSFYGYSAWNTSANTLGSLICASTVRYYAKKYNKDAFKKLQIIRFLDDWAYQANVRQRLKAEKTAKPDVRKLKKMMQPYEKKLNKLFEMKTTFKYKFPWKRFFELGIY